MIRPWLVVLQALLALVGVLTTIFVARFTYQLVHTDRPYLLVQSAQLTRLLPAQGDPPSLLKGDFQPSATLYVRNFGKGPCIIDNVSFALEPVAKIPKARNYQRCEAHQPDVGALASGESHKLKLEGRYLSPDDFDAIRRETKRLILYGVLAYRDVFNSRYETGFFWTFSALVVNITSYNVEVEGKQIPVYTGPFFRVNDRKRNYRT